MGVGLWAPALQHSRTWREAPPRVTAGDQSQLHPSAAASGFPCVSSGGHTQPFQTPLVEPLESPGREPPGSLPPSPHPLLLPRSAPCTPCLCPQCCHPWNVPLLSTFGHWGGSWHNIARGWSHTRLRLSSGETEQQQARGPRARGRATGGAGVGSVRGRLGPGPQEPAGPGWGRWRGGCRRCVPRVGDGGPGVGSPGSLPRSPPESPALLRGCSALRAPPLTVRRKDQERLGAGL